MAKLKPVGGGKRRKRPNLGQSSPSPQGSRPAASLIWCYWGDSPLTTMGQETMRLKKAMDGYAYKVLLKHNQTPSWIDLSEGDERRADVMMPPTPDNFTNQLVALAQNGYMIDVFVFSHGDTDKFWASTGVFGNDTHVTGSRIRALPAAAGLAKLPIRMVYQTQCYAASLNNDWRAAGAKVSLGARYIQFYPNQFGNFIDKWNNGDTVAVANTGADSNWVRTQAQTYILGDAVARRAAGKFDGCPFGKTVLGKDDCARKYHVPRWLRESEWQSSMSGKQNMNYSSQMVFSGNRQITKATQPRW
jgi:hypothetical protein